MTLKTYIATESIEDLRGHSNRRLSTILKNPAHPMHAAAKSEFDRRKGQDMKENNKLANLKLINKIKRSGVVKTGSMSKNEAVEQIDELTAAELKLINQMYDKKGNLTPMGKKVMAHGKSNSKLTPKNRDADNARRKEYNAYQKSKRNEAVDVEEALERDGPKKPDIFGPKGSFGKSASTTPAVQKYMAKRAAANQARNKAMDPGADKKGYGIGVTDTDKADKKAKAKGTSMMKRMGSRGKMYKAGKMM